MFYPVESLKRNGRFYLCWVADSWPLRFATITRRQLWSQDIRKICDDLVEVITIESGRPDRRFSLRLSAQLMRGLARIYQRKVTDFLNELCMLYANVSKHVNRKFVYIEVATETRPQLPVIVLPEQPENEREERIEDIIQRSRNVVANVQDITLRETTLPEQQPLLNDNFGEVNPEQPLQLLADKTVEMMMAEVSVAQHSLETPALDFSVDKSHDKSHDRSHDRSRLAPHAHDTAQMERISEHDLTLYKKSVGDEMLQIGDIEKEVPAIPDITAILPPEPAVPLQEMEIGDKEKTAEQEIPVEIPAPAEELRPTEPELVVLEELEEGQRQAKRRRLRNKMIDKHTQLSSSFLRSRIGNNAVDLRCEDSTEDIIKLIVPSDILLGRAAHAGLRTYSSLSYTISRLFTRNLGVVNKRPYAEREMEEPRTTRRYVRSPLERIEELPEPAPQVIAQPAQPELEPEMNVSNVLEVVPQDIQPMDVSDLPTQVIGYTGKRSSEYEITPKRPRRCGYVSFRHSQQIENGIPQYEADKENIPDNIPLEFQQQSVNTERDLTSMLQEVGLADLPQERPAESQGPKEILQSRERRGSESSETPLGSLDRTKVSLGDSDNTTDSRRFIRDQWGTEGTMIKILRCVKVNIKPLNIDSLIVQGPLLSGYKSIIVARCFTSILKLKQHDFIIIRKDPQTLEIKDITLGPKFYQEK